jgi:iron(III) transport system ATP-binding protein
MTGVTVSDLSKSFRDQPVLRGVGLAVPDGSVTALLGPSGCGKTTLLRLIAGFERPDSGEIRIGEALVAGPDRVLPPEQRHIGYVPQEGALFPHLTVAGNVGYGLPRSQRKGVRVTEILDLVGLGGFADRYPRQLSGGQQQRAALARALAPGPALILLDEPFNALDLDLRRSMSAEVIALLRRAGATAILVTHDPAEAFASADLVAVMQSGRIMQFASPEAVYRTPANLTVARLTGATVLLDGRVVDGAVETPLGTLPRLGGDAPASGTVTAMLRPEQIVLVSDGAGVEAKVLERRFYGDHSALLVEGSGFRLEVRTTAAVANGTVRLRVKGGCVVFAE